MSEKDKIVDTTPILTERYALSAMDFLVVVTMVVAYLLFYYLPLPNVGVWRSIAVGQVILTELSLPSHDPQLPLAAATTYRETTWLTQVIAALIDQVGGPEAISFAATMLAIGYLLFVYFIAGRGSPSQALSLFAVIISALTLLFSWHGLSPGLIATVWFALFMSPLLIDARWRGSNRSPSLIAWCVAPVVIVAWANSHWTFLLAPLIGWAIALGVAWDFYHTCGKLSETLRSRRVQSWAWFAQVCFFATLLNPWGFGVWSEAIGQLIQMRDGSQPLILASWLGAIVAVLGVAYVYLLRRSPAPVYGGDLAMLGTVGVLSFFNTSFVLLGVAIAIAVSLPLVTSLARYQRSKPAVQDADRADDASEQHRPFRFAFSMLAILAIWIGFALSPISAPILGGAPRPLAKAVSDPPIEVVEYLNTHPRARFIFAPVDQSDWIGYAASESPDLFVSSAIAELPDQVKYDYRLLLQGDSQWKRVLDRYDVDTVVIDKRSQAGFAAKASGELDDQWQLALESDRTLIIERRVD